jgi:hypothetical protein
MEFLTCNFICKNFGVRFDANVHWAKVDQRRDHGYVSPLDGGRRPGIAIRITGY